MAWVPVLERSVRPDLLGVHQCEEHIRCENKHQSHDRQIECGHNTVDVSLCHKYNNANCFEEADKHNEVRHNQSDLSLDLGHDWRDTCQEHDNKNREGYVESTHGYTSRLIVVQLIVLLTNLVFQFTTRTRIVNLPAERTDQAWNHTSLTGLLIRLELVVIYDWTLLNARVLIKISARNAFNAVIGRELTFSAR